MLLACAAVARAGERITLADGAEFECVKHEAVEGGKVRLYLKPSASGVELNTLDIAAERISRVEIVADESDAPASSRTAGATSKPAAFLFASLRPTQRELGELLSHAGLQHNIDADLLASVVAAESGGHVRAVSRAGAQGLMQLMPGTASAMGVHDAFAPGENVEGGTRYLDELLTRYHDNIALALAAYNAGPGAVDRYKGIPPYRETRMYVARVIREFNRRKTVLAAQSLTAQSVSTPGR